MTRDLRELFASPTKGEALCLEKSKSLTWLHWGTIALFLVAYTGAPILWGKIGMYPAIIILTLCGFLRSWDRVGIKRTKKETATLLILGSALVVIGLLVDTVVFGTISLFGADLVAAVCAAYSFSLKKTWDYLFIIASSAAIVVICALSRSALSLVPIMLYLGLLIPVAHFGLKEHLRRTRQGNHLSIEAQGKSGASYSSFLLPALILLLLTAALFFLLPKPLHRPPDELRKIQVKGQKQSPTDLQKELPSPEGEGGSSFGPTGSGEGERLARGEEGASSSEGETPTPADSADEMREGKETGQQDESAQADEDEDTEESPEEEGGLYRALLFEVESAEPQLLKLKAFDLYDRGEWRCSTQATSYQSDSPQIDLARVLSEIDDSDRGNFSQAHMVFYLHCEFGREMPVGLNPVAVRLPEHNREGSYGVFEDINANLFSQIDMPAGYSYAVTSLIPTRIVLSDGVIPPDIENSYTLKYAGCPGLTEMAASATAGWDTQQEKVTALLEYMHENFTYDPYITLEEGNQSLDDYINRERSGDALLATTAMTLLCREVGVPARLVTGFFPREFDQETGRFKVYSSDAYAWVEIYFPHSGWLPFSPDPARIANQGESQGEESRQGIPSSTEEGISRPDGTTGEEEFTEWGTDEQQIQESMENLEEGKGLEEGSGPQTSVLGREFKASGVILIFIAVLSGLIILLLIGIKLFSWYKKRRGKGKKTKTENIRKRSMAQDSGLYVHLTYKKMCEELAAAGLKRDKSETPDEYMDRIDSDLPAIAEYAEPITSALKDVIYGMREVSGEYLHHLEVCLQYLTARCRAAPAEE